MVDPKGRIEELAQANLKAVPANPCGIWDEMVARQDGARRPQPIDCGRSVFGDARGQ